METKVKQNGSANQETATVKKDVQRKLTNEAIGKPPVPMKPIVNEKPMINLDERIQNFEKLKGLATQRERLTEHRKGEIEQQIVTFEL